MLNGLLANRRIGFSAAAVLLVAMVGCAASNRPAESSDSAQCLVCLYNADLACVEIQKTDQTPQLVYQGRTYYFCSPECQAAFARHPDRYTGAAK